MCKTLALLSVRVKTNQILSIFKITNQFLLKFCIILQCHEKYFLSTFWLKFYVLSTKGAYESTHLVKFQASSRKSEILHFDGLVLFKSYKVSAKKVQNSYHTWH